MRKSWETCPLIKFQVPPRLIIGSKKKEQEMCMSECRQNFTLTQTINRVFFLCSTTQSVCGSDGFVCRFEWRLTLVYLALYVGGG